MRDRHWEQLALAVEYDLKKDKSFNLSKASEVGILQNLGQVTSIADVASKEFSIEQALDKMEREWEGILLSVQPYRESGTFIIKVEEQIIQQLDDHIGQ